MKILLDTATFVWLIAGSRELSDTARRVVQDHTTEVYLSSISAWEIVLKHALGRVELEDAPETLIPREREKLGARSLPLDEAASLHQAKLPRLHRDPFDRMLVCQALMHDLTILTPDRSIRQYPVRTLW